MVGREPLVLELQPRLHALAFGKRQEAHDDVRGALAALHFERRAVLRLDHKVEGDRSFRAAQRWRFRALPPNAASASGRRRGRRRVRRARRFRRAACRPVPASCLSLFQTMTRWSRRLSSASERCSAALRSATRLRSSTFSAAVRARSRIRKIADRSAAPMTPANIASCITSTVPKENSVRASVSCACARPAASTAEAAEVQSRVLRSGFRAIRAARTRHPLPPARSGNAGIAVPAGIGLSRLTRGFPRHVLFLSAA